MLSHYLTYDVCPSQCVCKTSGHLWNHGVTIYYIYPVGHGEILVEVKFCTCFGSKTQFYKLFWFVAHFLAKIGWTGVIAEVQPNWPVSIFYVIYVIYDIKCHIITNDLYDIVIWHKSIWSILVSKWPLNSIQSHPFIRFWLKHSLKIKNKK